MDEPTRGAIDTVHVDGWPYYRFYERCSFKINIDIPKGRRVKFKIKGADMAFDSFTIAGQCFRREYRPPKSKNVIVVQVPCSVGPIYAGAVLADTSGDTLVLPLTPIGRFQSRKLFGHCDRTNEVAARFLFLQVRGRLLCRKYLVRVP